MTTGSFREDLFYRLNVFAFTLRRCASGAKTCPRSSNASSRSSRERSQPPPRSASPKTRDGGCARYDWPGNVRELRNMLERAAALAADDLIEADQILPAPALKSEGANANNSPAEGTAPNSAPVTLEQLERQHILRVLEESNGNRERASAILGISARTLYRKLREYETGASG